MLGAVFPPSAEQALLHGNESLSHYGHVELLGEKVKDLDYEAVRAVLDGYDASVYSAGVHGGEDGLEVDVWVEGFVGKRLQCCLVRKVSGLELSVIERHGNRAVVW